MFISNTAAAFDASERNTEKMKERALHLVCDGEHLLLERDLPPLPINGLAWGRSLTCALSSPNMESTSWWAFVQSKEIKAGEALRIYVAHSKCSINDSYY